MPAAIKQALYKFRKNKEQTALLIRNCPIDQALPSTPYSGRLSIESHPISCLVNIALYRAMGIKPIVYQGENDGQLFRHVVPAKHAMLLKSSHGSTKDFGFHVDNPDLPLQSEPINSLSACPDYLSLFGMRCDPSVPTKLIITRELVSAMPTDIIDILTSPRFTVLRPQSFGQAKKTTNLAILSKGAEGQWLSRFDAENVYPQDDEASRALKCLKSAILNKCSVV